MEKKDRNKWTNKFREMGKKKGSRQDFIKLYKEMKKDKDKKDKINEYEKGVAGGDWLQEVVENDFTIAKILYERKNTKAWSNGWIKKLQDDMKDSKSDVGIIFTKALPKEFPKNKLWDHKGNIFICKYNFIALNALASMQRWHLADKNKESLKTEVESWKDLVEENKN